MRSSQKFFRLPDPYDFNQAAKALNITIRSGDSPVKTWNQVSIAACEEDGAWFDYSVLEEFLVDADDEEERERLNAPYVLFAEASRLMEIRFGMCEKDSE